MASDGGGSARRSAWLVNHDPLGTLPLVAPNTVSILPYSLRHRQSNYSHVYLHSYNIN